MRTSHLLCRLLLGLSQVACVTLTDKPLDLTCIPSDGGVAPDMASPAVKCAAAKGLAGDNLLCVDFDKVTQLADPALAGWNFNANMADCWQISGGTLSVKNFGTFMGNCGLTLPPLDLKQADKAQYQKVTLTLVHKVDMSDVDQNAQVFLDLDAAARLLHQTTARPGIPTLTTTTLTVHKADLPMTLQSVYKFYLKASALSPSGRPGWQIQSVAVNGSP
jgi:hypothetical protein